MNLKKYGIVILLGVFFIFQVVNLFQEHPPWWDAAVYVGMAKYLFSGGHIGLWEEFRPLGWPFLLGFFWKMGMNIFFIGYVLQMIFSIGTVYLTYRIALKYVSWKSALLAASFIAFNATFFFFWTKLYSEIPATFFSLLAIFFFLEKKFTQSGIFAALSFLTKFPLGITFAILWFILLFKKEIKNSIFLAIPFFITTLPFFIFNFLMYQNPFYPLITGHEIIKYAGIWIFQEPWYFYVINILKENIFFLFAFAGAIFIWKKNKYDAVFWIFLSFFLYFGTLTHKEMRFTIAFIPLLAIIAVRGIPKLFEKKTFVYAFILIIVLGQFFFMLPHEPLEDFKRVKEFAQYPLPENQREILTTNPLVSLYREKTVKPIYFYDGLFEFNETLMNFWTDYIKKDNADYIFFDTCEGGTLCSPEDPTCEIKKQEFLNFLNSYKIIYSKKQGRCEYFIFFLQQET